MKFLLVFAMFCVSFAFATSPEIIYKWKKFDFNNLPRNPNDMIYGHKYYNPGNCIPTGFAYHIKSGLMFITIPRVRHGVPATLNIVNVRNNPKHTIPRLTAFPNYEVNDLLGLFDHGPIKNKGRGALRTNNATKALESEEELAIDTTNTGIDAEFGEDFGEDIFSEGSTKIEPDKHTVDKFTKHSARPRITSVYNPKIDKYDRLWFMDTGLLEYNKKVVQKPSLWVIDLSLDQYGLPKKTVLRRHIFPDGLIIDPVGLYQLTVDTYGNGPEHTFAYIPNYFDNRTIVYDYHKKRSWYFSHSSFKPDQTENNFNVEGVKYHYDLGILDITLGWKNSDGFKTAFYFAGANTAIFKVSTKILRNRELAPHGYGSKDFRLHGFTSCKSQKTSQAFDSRTGVFYYAEHQTSSIRCWNIDKPLLPKNVGTVYYTHPELIVPMNIFFDRAGNLWFMSNRYTIWLFSHLSLDDYNFHIFRLSNVAKIIKGTVCEPSNERHLTIDVESDDFRNAQRQLSEYQNKQPN